MLSFNCGNTDGVYGIPVYINDNDIMTILRRYQCVVTIITTEKLSPGAFIDNLRGSVLLGDIKQL